MRVLIDTNVVLDVLLNRPAFVNAAAAVLKIPESDAQKYVSASAVTDIYYIAYHELRDKELVKDLLRRLLRVVHVADVSESEIISALNSGWSDFEDSVQNAVAELHGFDAIITRNPCDFKTSNLKIIPPADFATRWL